MCGARARNLSFSFSFLLVLCLWIPLLTSREVLRTRWRLVPSRVRYCQSVASPLPPARVLLSQRPPDSHGERLMGRRRGKGKETYPSRAFGRSSRLRVIVMVSRWTLTLELVRCGSLRLFFNI